MTHVTLRSSQFARLPARIAPLALACALGAFTPLVVLAQTAVAPKPVTAVDVAAAPLDTLNLRKKETEPVLEAALARPYALPANGRCAAINHEVASLNAVLGPDIDDNVTASENQKRARVVAGTARSVVSSVIPFGGIVRLISGANAADAHRATYLYAGSVRRAYLKGYARATRCHVTAAAVAANRAK